MGEVLTSVCFSKYSLFFISLISLVFISSFALSAVMPVNNASCGTVSVPDSMEAGKEYIVFVDMLNSGNTSWDSTIVNPYRLGSQNPQDNSIWGFSRVSKVCNTALGNCSVSNVVDLRPANIVPGASGWYRFYFKVKAPSTAGTYAFKWRMVQEGKQWFGATCGKSITVNSVQPPVSGVNNASCGASNIPSSMIAGKDYEVFMDLQNTGSTKWDISNRFALGSQNSQDNFIWGLNRASKVCNVEQGNCSLANLVDLKPANIVPGAPGWYRFYFKVKAPSTAGTYNFNWKMVQDGKEWFGATCGKSIKVSGIGSACEMSLIPESNACGLKLNEDITGFLDLNGNYALKTTIKNTTGQRLSVSGSWMKCRCPEGRGQAFAKGTCGGWWNGESFGSNYSKACVEIPSIGNIVLAPFEQKQMQVNVSQFNNLFCGSFQLDYIVKQVNGVQCSQLMSYGLAYTCVDCNKPKKPVCGNGILEPGEECDDGNLKNGDGCSSTCRIEHECIADSDCPSIQKQCAENKCVNNACVETPKPSSTSCNNGLFCDGLDHCDGNGNCVSKGIAVNCSAFNLNPVRKCNNSPDCNPFTWDFFPGFTSVCDENKDKCTTGTVFLTHACSVEKCNAECDENHACAPTECDANDGCRGRDYYDFNDAGNSCLENCSCTNNQCSNPKIIRNDPRCGECSADDDCDRLDRNYCEGSKIKRDEGKCVEHSCKVETSTVQECNDNLFCNGVETCSNARCVSGSAVNCSGFDLNRIGECNHVPDSNPFTWDFFPGFTSACNERTDSCTQGIEKITSKCSVKDCNAECEFDSDCSPTKCNDRDGCKGNDYYDYSDAENTCNGCKCSDNECTDPIIIRHDPRCTQCQTDSDCNSLNRNYCDGSKVMRDKGKCVDFACETETSKVLECNDGLFCNGVETCSNANCVAGSAINCSQFNLNPIGKCNNSPDCNPFTWDFFPGFTSACNERTDSCTTGIIALTHTCSVEKCNAECDENHACASTECDANDGCRGRDYYDFNDAGNSCLENCSCTNNQCSNPKIIRNDPRCGECSADDDCDRLDRNYCEGSKVMRDEGKCVNYSCVKETSTVQECNDNLFCNGVETCSNAKCVAGSVVNCSQFNLNPVGECNHTPDGFPKTWDFFAGFTSHCDERQDKCTTGAEIITSTCSMRNCNAECESDSNCTAHLSDNYCYFSGECSEKPSCSCSFESEYCPVPGTIKDGYCYWGHKECKNNGCDLNKSLMKCFETCNPLTGPEGGQRVIKTTKHIGSPKIECDYFGGDSNVSECWFASGKTKFSFSTNIAGVKTYYRQRIKQDYNSAWGSWSSWTLYTSKFSFKEDSIHELEYYSVDEECGLEEAHNFEIDIIDSKPPVQLKTVGEPKTSWNGSGSIFYPENKCDSVMDCWKITLMTQISMECTDSNPHPVGGEEVCFNVGLDGDDATQAYCIGDYNKNGDGYCCFSKKTNSFAFNEETEHYLKYYCTDSLGNKSRIDEELFKVEGKNFTIKLNKKWNLISIPFVLKNPSPEAVFESVAGSIEAVWNFDAVSNKWRVFTPDGNSTNDDLTEIVPGSGYWISAYNADTLVLGGSLFSPIITPPSKQIKKGWNMIGYYGTDGVEMYDGPHNEGRPAKCVLYSLGASVLDKGWTSLMTYWEPLNPDQWKFYNYDDKLDPGAGYWISATEDGVYSYTANCASGGI